MTIDKKSERTLTITKAIPHIVNNETEVSPEDVILSYSDILNNPKNLTNANISKIEINFKSIDAKTDDEKLLLKNSLEYLEFLKTSSSTTGDLFCINFSKENILKKTWTPQKEATKATQTEVNETIQTEANKATRAMETIIEASPRSENLPIEDLTTIQENQNNNDSPRFIKNDKMSLESIFSPRNNVSNKSIFRIVREEVKKDNIDPSSQKIEKNEIELKVIIQSEKPEMKTFLQTESSHLMQTPVKARDVSDELSLPPRMQIRVEENGVKPTIVASLGYVTSPNSRNDNSVQQAPNPETTQRDFSKGVAHNSTGCSSGLMKLLGR